MTTYGRPYPPDSLTTQQAAEVLGVTVDTVMRWRSQGLLPEIEAPSGRRPRFFGRQDVADLAARLGGERMPRQWRGLDLSHIAPDDPLRERFWSKVGGDGSVPLHRPELGSCREWTEYRGENGYGQFALASGDYRLAQVVSYALTKGPVPPRMYVCHHCDNPPCVRPDHLFLGPPLANVLDMFAKGRQGSRHPGMERPNARLTDEDVRAIRSVPPYFGRYSDLARQYGRLHDHHPQGHRRQEVEARRMSTPIGRLLQIAVDVAALEWMDQALCGEVGGDEWFPEKGGSSREAKAVCRRCEVRGECLAYALEHGEGHGIWGGLSERERRRLKRQPMGRRAA